MTTDASEQRRGAGTGEPDRSEAPAGEARRGRLDGKVAIVTGAGSTPGPGVGTGKATAIVMAREGAKVVCVDLHPERAEETRAVIEEEGGTALVVRADCTSSDDCQGNLECVRGEKSLFRDLSFRLEAGACLMVQGANGSGKTSLLRMLCGLAQPAQGEIRWGGEPIRKLAEDYRGELLYCGHAGAVKDDLTALENAQISATLAGAPVDEASARQALRQLGLKGREDLPARVLSAGQRRRVALSRLLLEKRRLWVLDEPLTALDKTAVTTLCGVIDAHLATGGMAVLTSHQDLPLAADRIAHLRLD